MVLMGPKSFHFLFQSKTFYPVTYTGERGGREGGKAGDGREGERVRDRISEAKCCGAVLSSSGFHCCWSPAITEPWLLFLAAAPVVCRENKAPPWRMLSLPRNGKALATAVRWRAASAAVSLSVLLLAGLLQSLSFLKPPFALGLTLSVRPWPDHSALGTFPQ